MVEVPRSMNNRNLDPDPSRIVVIRIMDEQYINAVEPETDEAFLNRAHHAVVAEVESRPLGGCSLIASDQARSIVASASASLTGENNPPRGAVPRPIAVTSSPSASRARFISISFKAESNFHSPASWGSEGAGT